MIDWHGRGVSKNGKAQMSIHQYLNSQTQVLQWVDDQERINEGAGAGRAKIQQRSGLAFNLAMGF